jgi:hypothetical protein
MTTVQEFRRTCNQCGQVWHSLATREETLKTDSFCNSCEALCNACGDRKLVKAAEHNAQTADNELARLQHCPKCSSSNYTEEVISYNQS